VCKVMIVDDEIPDLEGLKRFIPWEELGMQVTAAVNDARKALVFMTEQPIDILVTDIKMPRMSGLELTEQAVKLNPRVKVIFVSSYADFHYAKQAVSLKAFGYVLKPVDDKELIQLLLEAKSALEQERVTRLQQKQAGENVYVLRNNLLQDWFEGLIADQEAVSRLAAFDIAAIHESYQAAIAEMDDVGRFETFDEERTEHIRTIMQIMESRRSKNEIRILYKSSNLRFVLLLAGSQREARDELTALLEEIQSQTGQTITIGLGGPTAQLADLPLSYKQALMALDAKMFIGKNRVLTPMDAKPEVARDVVDLETQFELLFQATSDYALVAIHDTLESIFQLIQASRSKVSVYNFAYFICSKLESYLKHLKEDVQSILGANNEVLMQVLALETIEDIKKWLRKLFFQISEHLNAKRQTIGQKLVREIEEYVTRNLSGKITLKDLGDYLSFSGNYLGHLYKNMTGVTFGDYLNARRMEKAKELLDDPRLKIFEIAECVGYRDLPYFTKQFKEYYQLTPSEYRKRAK